MTNVRGTQLAATAALLLGVVAGCGADEGGADRRNVDPTYDASASPDDSRPTERVNKQSNKLGPQDVVLARCDDSGVKLWVAPNGDESAIRLRFEVDSRASLQAIGLQGSASCGYRTSFNEDFSKVVAGGYTPERLLHVAVIDLASGEATDLTEPRQGKGYSAGEPLDEGGGQFQVSEGAVRPSMSRVIVPRPKLVVDANNPAEFEPISDVPKSEAFGDGVYFRQGQVGGDILSPDGRFLLYGRAGAWPLILKAREMTETDEIRPPCSAEPLGWLDADQAVVAGRERETGRRNYYLVSVSDGSFGGCEAILPESKREPASARLSLNRKRLYVSVDGPNGSEWYAADPRSPGSEPKRIEEPLDIDSRLKIYFPTG